MALAATKGAHVKAVVPVGRGTLRGGVRTSNVPIDAKDLVVGCGETETRVAFCPDDLPVGKFCGGRGLEVEENSMSPLRTDEADGGGRRFAAACQKGLGGG